MKRMPKQYFRACVGAVILKGEEALVLERVRHPGSWQFPQGGLEADEEPEDAAWREILEETGIGRDKLRLLCRHPEVLTYELPADWRSSKTGLGQSQFWFYFQFLGDDADITFGDGKEFSASRWVPMREAVEGAVAFRQPVYKRLNTHLQAALGHVPSEPLGPVTLREITQGSLSPVLQLTVSDDQQRFVANNAISIAQAMYEPKSWLRAIYAGETPVGLILMEADPNKPEYYLWRLLIGSRHQGQGYGRAAVLQLAAHVRTCPNGNELLVSYVPGDGSPRGFYEKLGFVDTGELEEGEVMMRLTLT